MSFQGGYPGAGGGYPGAGGGGGYPGAAGSGGGYPGAGGGGGGGGYPGGYHPPQGYQQPGAYHPGQQPGGYAPQPPSAGIPGISPDVERMFNAVDTDRSGKITAKELQAALQNGKGENFTDKCCQLLVSMFDTQNSGSLDIQQFAKLFEYINQWLNIFKTYDRNGSGQIDDQELNQAFTQMGFQFTPNFTKQLSQRSHDHKEVSVDEFIVLCVTIQRLTEAFRVRDSERSGRITIAFEDFLSVVLTNTN